MIMNLIIKLLICYNIGNHFDRFETGAFFNLPFLREIAIPAKTLQWIEPKAFTDLPKLESLDLHDQLLSNLPQNLTFGYKINTYISINSLNDIFF